MLNFIFKNFRFYQIKLLIVNGNQHEEDKIKRLNGQCVFNALASKRRAMTNEELRKCFNSSTTVDNAERELDRILAVGVENGFIEKTCNKYALPSLRNELVTDGDDDGWDDDSDIMEENGADLLAPSAGAASCSSSKAPEKRKASDDYSAMPPPKVTRVVQSVKGRPRAQSAGSRPPGGSAGAASCLSLNTPAKRKHPMMTLLCHHQKFEELVVLEKNLEEVKMYLEGQVEYPNVRIAFNLVNIPKFLLKIR